MIIPGRKRLFFIVFLVFILIISGCDIILPFGKKKTPDPVSDLSAGSVFIDTADIRLQTISLINHAQKAIFIELSALNDPEIIDLIIDRSQNGVEVRILLDQWQRDNISTVRNLKNHNISVQYYPAQKGQHHRIRFLVIDYQVAVFYGQDWVQKLSDAHSLAIKLTGKTAWTLAKSFARDWEYTTTLKLDLPESLDLPEDQITLALNSNVRNHIISAINQASDIYAIVEQISENETIKALIAAKERGCRIRLILSPSCAEATPNTVAAFKEAGIELRYYKPPENQTMSINLGVFDNKKIIISSSSWSYPTFVTNHEGSLTIPSPQAAEKVNSVFEENWLRANPA